MKLNFQVTSHIQNVCIVIALRVALKKNCNCNNKYIFSNRTLSKAVEEMQNSHDL